MNLNSTFSIFDIEADGLLDEVSKIHVLSYANIVDEEIIEKGYYTEYQDIINYFNNDFVFVGHKIITYDIPVIEKITGIDLSNIQVIDTLSLSYYLLPNQKIHGLDYYGKVFNNLKPKITDWKSLSIKDYIHRCNIDVEINTELFIKSMSYLKDIYIDENLMFSFIRYLNFKQSCLRDQESIGIKLDLEKVNIHLTTLTGMFEEKRKILSDMMPKYLGKVIKTKPKVIFKKDGTLSSNGLKWYQYVTENNINPSIEEVRESPNPGSDNQLKQWLFSLGWKPITFKESKQTGKNIPQVSLPFGGGICSSVKDLYVDNPDLKELEDYFKIKHRIGIFKSYLDNEKNGKVYAQAMGFSKTHRLKHSKPIANLPKPGVFYGKEVREVLTVEEGYLMCGSDISGLEDNTKQHYIYYFDPDYVTQMRVPGFDPHIDIAILANLMTKEEEEFFKYANTKKDLTADEIFKFAKLKKIRSIAKSANFAATYGAGGPKIAETAKISLQEGYNLHNIYWNRNKAVKQTAESLTVKEVRGQKWLQNPISKFWLFLSAEKDRFSACNQNSGVYVFDTWLLKLRPKLKVLDAHIILQYHDSKFCRV